MGLIFLEPEARAIYDALPAPAPVVRSVPQDVLGVSKLTADACGREIWLDLCAIVHAVTGKVHRHKENPEEWYYNGDRYIKMPEGDVEGFVHELCHWIVASPAERAMDNLGLNEAPLNAGIATEEAVWALESWLFSPFVSEVEVGSLVSAVAAEVVAFGADHPTVNNPVDSAIRGLSAARASNLDVPLLRGVLGRWLRWRSANDASPASPPSPTGTSAEGGA